MRAVVAGVLLICALGCGSSPSSPTPAVASAPAVPRAGDWATRGSAIYCVETPRRVPAAAADKFPAPAAGNEIVIVGWSTFNIGTTTIHDDGMGRALNVDGVTYKPLPLDIMEAIYTDPHRWGGLAALFEVPAGKDAASFEIVAADGSRLAFDVTGAKVDNCGKVPPGETMALTIGEEFTVGTYAYRIDGWDAYRAIGNQFAGYSAPEGAQIVVVTYAIRNDANETVTILASDMTLEDARGRKFSPSSEVETALAMQGGKGLVAQQLQPGIMTPQLTGFLVPDDAMKGAITAVIPGGLTGASDARIPLPNAIPSDR